MIATLLQRLKGELALALTRTFIARGIAAVGGVLLFVVLGRLYGAEGVGVFALAQSIYLGAGILARYGMDNALMRYVGQDPTSSAVSVYLRWALTKSAFLSIAVGVLVFLSRDQLSQFFGAPMLILVLPGVALAIPPFTAAFVLAGFMKGIRKPAAACLLENGAIALFTAVLVVFFDRISNADVAMAGWALAVGAWLVLLLGVWQVFNYAKKHGFRAGRKVASANEFNSSTKSFLYISLSNFFQQTVFIIIVRFYVSDCDLGMLKVAERTALLVSFILIVVNAVLPPRFARLYQLGKIEELLQLFKKSAVIGLVLASPLLAMCILCPTFVLSFYGSEFLAAAPLLRIIALGQAINVATGSVGFLLNMTGNELLVRNISLLSNMLGLIALLVLLKFGGVLGAAFALSLTLCIHNLAFLYYVKKIIFPMRHCQLDR